MQLPLSPSAEKTSRRRFWRSGVILVLLLSSRIPGAPRVLLAQSLAIASGADAKTPASAPPRPASLSTNRDRWIFGAQLGFALENDIPRNISHITLLIAQPQVGFIAHNSKSPRFPVQRLEILSEGIFGNAIHPGGRLTGYALLFRLDGKPRGRVVPFFDVGAGVLNTTLNSRAPELSGRLQFSPQGGFGIQYFFNPQRAFVFEYRYLHMSNASIEPPNHGFNANMVTLGFRWLRRPVRPALLSPHHSRNPLRSLLGSY